MAIAGPREGPPRRGAGPFRLPVAGKKAALVAGLPIALILLVLTWDKTVFLARLTMAALSPQENGRGRVSVLAACAFRRPALLPLLAAEAGNPDFLAAWIGRHLRHGEDDFGKKGYGPFLDRVAARFPENVMLRSLGFYGEGDATRDWGNFDRLFFRLVSDPEFNELSYGTLTGALRDGRLSTTALGPLLSYLAWMENLDLARGLRKWAAGGGATADALSGFSPELLSPPPAPAPEPGQTGEADDISSALGRLLRIDSGRIALGENLIEAADFRDPQSLDKSWEFLDMSDREPFSKGSFAGGPDLRERAALRVMGFFTKSIPGRIPGRAGFGRRKAIPLGPDIYVFYFSYRTEGVAEQPSVWFTAPEYFPERELAPSPGGWRRVFCLLKNASTGAPELKPILRMWGTGTVWFTGVGLRALNPNGGQLPPGKEILLYE